MNLIDIRNKIDATPGLPAWEFGMKCYAADMFMQYVDDKGLNMFSDIKELGPVTEKDLLNGSKDWKEYSKDGNALSMEEDICRRLSGTAPKKEDCAECLHTPEDLISMQANALEQAAQLIIDTVKEALEEG